MQISCWLTGNRVRFEDWIRIVINYKTENSKWTSKLAFIPLVRSSGFFLWLDNVLTKDIGNFSKLTMQTKECQMNWIN